MQFFPHTIVSLARQIALAFVPGIFLIVSAGCITARDTGTAIAPVARPVFSRVIPDFLIDLSSFGTGEVLWQEAFHEVNLTGWKEVEVRGKTNYKHVVLDGASCLEAHSQGGASIMLSKLEFNPEEYRVLSWRWRVEKFVEGEALDKKDGSDASARIYVYFNTRGLPWQRRNIDYVWSSTLPVGTVIDSAYISTSKIIVAESGTEHLGQWRTVKRDLIADYKLCFDDDPPNVIAIGVMTDTDNTDSHAIAYFDDFEVRGLSSTAKNTISSDGKWSRSHITARVSANDLFYPSDY